MRQLFSIWMTPLITVLNHKELLFRFIIKEIKGRFVGSFAGVFWTLLAPLATIISYFFVFAIVLRINVSIEETGTDRFVVFFLCGFFPWLMFSESLGRAVGVLVQESVIITKVVFPIEILPISTVVSNFIINVVGFVFLLVYLAFKGYLTTKWLYIPLILIIEMFFTLGLSFFLAAICVFIRDTAELFKIVIMLWFFGTPIIYPISMVPERFDLVFLLNPMVDFVTNIRNCLLMDTVDIWSLAGMLLFSVISYCAGTHFFIRSKSAFGDIL